MRAAWSLWEYVKDASFSTSFIVYPVSCLVLLTRETPLNQIHLENMLELTKMGAVILPPMPAFYNHPQNLTEMVDHIVFRTLDQFGMPNWSSVRNTI